MSLYHRLASRYRFLGCRKGVYTAALLAWIRLSGALLHLADYRRSTRSPCVGVLLCHDSGGERRTASPWSLVSEKQKGKTLGDIFVSYY
jgi:hypothetical protein